MIDTIKAYIEISSIGILDHYQRIKEFNNVVVYKVRNIHFYVYHDQGIITHIAFKGSLTKFVDGNNVNRSNRLTILRAIALLKKATGLPILEFKITQLDVAVNVRYEGNIPELLDRLEYLPRYYKVGYSPHSVRFQSRTKNTVLKFYDKQKEADEKPERHSGYYNTSIQLLRVEFSQKFDIKRGYKIENFRAFLNEKTMNNIGDRLISVFNNVLWKKEPVVENIDKDGDFMDYLIMLGIEKNGGYEQTKHQLKDLTQKGKIKKQKSIDQRLSRAIKSNVFTTEPHITRFINSFNDEVRMAKLTTSRTFY